MKQQPPAPWQSLEKAALETKRKEFPKRKPRAKGSKRLTRWDSLQKETMTREFTSNGQNISKTARVLGLSRNAVLRKLKRYDLKTPEKQP